MSKYIVSFLYPDGFYIIDNRTGKFLNTNTGELVDSWDNAPFFYSDTDAYKAIKDYESNQIKDAKL